MSTVYSDQQRAEALARVLSGETVSGVARDMGIERTSLQKWLSRKRDIVNAVVTVQKPSLLILLGDYLEQNLGTMRHQAARMGERAWIEAQTTPDLISSHDHLGRRLVSILDRIQPILASIPDDEPADGDS